jgi:hypothetical protein
MKTFLVLAAVLVAALAAPTRSHAVWGAKARACPRWEAKLAALEQSGEPTDSSRMRALRAKIDGRCVALNEIQVLGSHNSFHIQARPALFALLAAFSPELAASLEYTHLPLPDQFSTQSVRQIELDVFADPAGGLYNLRRALILLGESADSGIPALKEPGFKVLHVQDIDFETTCVTFVECLQVVKRWSDTHRGHLPIAILVELKEDPIPDPVNLGFTVPLIVGAADLDALDAEIRSVLPRNKVLTPDDVRRGRPTLDEAVTTLGWPRLDAVRGKVLFLMDNGGAKRDLYRTGHPALEGRMIFTNSVPGDPDAAFVKLNDPFDPDIPDVVAAGYIVRTRADADTVEARTGDTAPREAALASGAQFVSTDYPVPNPAFGTGYFVQIPGGMPGRCNPVTGPAGCRVEGLERLR